jgi:hypothetical protein
MSRRGTWLHTVIHVVTLLVFYQYVLTVLKYSICSRNNQHYALTCTTPLFYILAPTCFGSSLQSSGSFLHASELLEMQIEWLVCHIMCYIPPFVFAFLVTQKNQPSTLMMAGYCRNM